VWSQGPFLLQTLKLLEPYDLKTMSRQSPEYIHTVTEAMKLCFADRDAYLGDPEFVSVPIEPMLSSHYLELRRALIDPQRASQEQVAGDPLTPAAVLGIPPQDHQVTSGKSDDTSNCLVADQWGNVVSATPSGWGGVIAGDTGIELGSRMIGLTCWQNHPSELMPGKRPRITLTPTLVCRDGVPVFAVSVAGGDQQDQASIQIVLNRLIHGMNPADSVRSGRFSTEHHINWFGHEPFKPGTLLVTRDVAAESVKSLETRGHRVTVGATAGRAVVLAIDPNTGEKHAAGDQGRYAAGY
jgi:gamma-glutamyltranspeptidase/glutathione hydrolase